MKYIRRAIINDIAGSLLKQKAVAFALFLKAKTRDASVVRHYSIYKLHKLSGMSYRTIRKYIDVLQKLDLVHISGGSLYIKRMVSSCKHRNINIARFACNKTKSLYNQIRDLIFLIIQAKKDFIKSLLRLRKNPRCASQLKQVRRLCKKCCNNPNAEYVEMGLSYARIAKQIGCCRRTAINVAKDAIERKWCVKENHCQRVKMEGVGYRPVAGFTFTTMNYGFILRPNTYALSSSWQKSLNTKIHLIPKKGIRA